MNNEPNKKNGAKPAVAHKKNILDDRRIRLALSVLGAIVAWMVVTIIVQPGTTQHHLQCAGGLYLRFRSLHLPGPEHRQRTGQDREPEDLR